MQDEALSSPQVVVIGSIFLDHKLIYATNEMDAARSMINYGGVGRNIAENLAWLRLEVGLITLSSADDTYPPIQVRLSNAGVKVIARSVEGGIGHFNVFLDCNGTMLNSFATPPPLDMLDWGFVGQYQNWLTNARYILIEMGLDFDLLKHILEHAVKNGIPVCGLPTRLEAVGPRWDLLSQLDCLILNNYEASLILGMPVENTIHASQAVERFRERGILRVAVTLGDAGVVAGTTGGSVKVYSAVPTKVVDTTGAGDAFAAGLIGGLVITGSFDDAIAVGLELARRTVEIYDTVRNEPAYILFPKI